MKPLFTIGVVAIIIDEQGRVLLCHRRDYDLWNLPGGGVESGETPWEAVIRETKEETGLGVTVDRLLGVYAKTRRGEIVFSFLCVPYEGEMTLNAEADQIQYFEIDHLPSNISPHQIERINDAQIGPTKIHFKKQNGKSAIELINEGLL